MEEEEEEAEEKKYAGESIGQKTSSSGQDARSSTRTHLNALNKNKNNTIIVL